MFVCAEKWICVCVDEEMVMYEEGENDVCIYVGGETGGLVYVCIFVCVETGICRCLPLQRLASLCGEIGVCSEGEAI